MRLEHMVEPGQTVFVETVRSGDWRTDGRILSLSRGIRLRNVVGHNRFGPSAAKWQYEWSKRTSWRWIRSALLRILDALWRFRVASWTEAVVEAVEPIIVHLFGA